MSKEKIDLTERYEKTGRFKHKQTLKPGQAYKPRSTGRQPRINGRYPETYVVDEPLQGEYPKGIDPEDVELARSKLRPALRKYFDKEIQPEDPHVERTNSPLFGSKQIQTLPGENSKYAAMMMHLAMLPQLDHDNVDELEERFWYTVKFLLDNDFKVTNKVIYFALGLYANEPHDWKYGNLKTPLHSSFLELVDAFCSGYRETLAADGKLHPTLVIWWQKNYDGFTDKNEVNFTQTINKIDTGDISQIRKRIEGGVALDAKDIGGDDE